MKKFYAAALMTVTFLAAAASARAQAYDNTTIHIDNLTSDSIYLVFHSASSLEIGYTNTSNVTANLSWNATTGWTNSLALSDVLNGNLFVYDANSAAAYVSYGSALNVTATPTAASSTDPNYNIRWQPFEFTRVNTDLIHANGDVTYINGFSAAMHIENFSGNYGALVSNGNSGILTTSTGSMMNSVYHALNATTVGAATLSPNLSAGTPASIVTSANTSSGTYVRITPPNSFPGTNSFGPYPSFGNYFTYIKDNNVVANITNLTFQVANWQYAYSFNATINATGNYVFAGYVTASNLTNLSQNVTENLTITLPNDTAGVLSYMTYQANYPFPAGTVFSGNWSNITSAQPVGTGGNQTAFDASVQQQLEQRILGDLAEGLNIGAIGSNVAFDLSGNLVAVGNMTSSEWFSYNPRDFYGNVSVQPNFYNVFSAAMLDATGNDSVSYYAPYDDRFQNAGSNPDIPMETLWVVTLNHDGNLNFNQSFIPEPATYGLIMSAVGLAFVAVYRRKSRATGK